ncbi:MAG: lipase family protein [Oscillatoriophycideae cyanobacterium NC_groundwater_1537_Pr4_S-0.65um_50_18]|nr:lipase family protein [Oscillatoriophycideae cyanobacterium NC_groundwater_1537_Pr4_S-0.65um_50_18]
MRFNRRFLLWSGLGTTIAAVFGREQLQQQALRTEQAKLRQLYDPTQLVQSAFSADLTSMKDLVAVQQSAKLRSPTIPYNREWSKLLITGSKLCTQQYLKGKFEANYDGSISTLPLYTKGFTSFQQLTSFKAAERVEEGIAFEVPLTALANPPDTLNELGDRVNQTKEVIQNQVKQVVNLKQQISVYYGFVLTSPKMNILMFRGTQRQLEWLENILAIQEDYAHPVKGTAIGKVHSGIYDFYHTHLAEAVKAAVQSLDPKKPLVISGHSLGAALATFAALDLALILPEFQSGIQVYTYAGPRLGNKAFVEAHSQLLPNHYRITNLADMIPMLPLSKLLTDDFVHVGESWSFLSQQGDIMPNHFVETYRQAIEQGAETRSDKGFDNLRVRLS